MHISELSVRRPITTFMFYAAVLTIGLVSLSKLAVDLLPDISYPRLTIWTQYPNVAPEEIEKLITRPIEARLVTLKDKKKITSTSQEGISLVTIDFDWGTDMNMAILFLREKLDDVRYSFPEGAERPVIIQVDPSSQPIMSLSVAGEGLVGLKESANAIIKRRLEQIDGVALATVTGGFDREIHVDVDMGKLATLNMSLGSISSAIDRANQSMPGGFIRKGRFRYSLRTIGEFYDVSQIEDVVVGTQGKGNLVYLRDIATVKDSFKEPENKTRYNGEESIGIIIQKEAGSNTVKVSESVKEVLNDLKEEFPEYNIAIAHNQADFISASISNVFQAIVFGAILAFLVLFLFLHDPRNPFNIAISIPLAIIATFSLLYFSDVSLNIMSLGGLALGIGMLVDNSIVVLENIFRHRQEGKGIIDATIAGAKEIGLAVTASTFTTVSVFFPIIFVEGVAGQLFRAQSLTITFSLLCSLIISLTLLPMLAARFLQFEKKEPEKITPLTGPEKDQSAVLPEREKKERGTLFQVFKAVLLPFKFIFYYAIYKGLIYYGIWKGIIYYTIYTFLLKWILGTIFLLVLGVLKYWWQMAARFLNFVFTPVFKSFDRNFERFADKYEIVLEKSLNNRSATITVAIAVFVLAGFVATKIDRELMPPSDQRQFEIEITMPVGSPLERTDAVALELSNILGEIEDVESVFSSVGIVQEKGIQSEETGSLNRGLIIVKLKQEGTRSTENIIQEVRDQQYLVPDAELNFGTGETTLQQILGTEEADITVNIQGEDFAESTKIMEEVLAKMREVHGLEDVHSSYEEGKPEVRITVDRMRADRYGVSVSQVANYIENSMGGNIATDFKDFDKKINVVVRPDLKYRDDLTDLLDNYYVSEEVYIPIRELIDYKYSKGPSEIRREDQVRTIQIFANIHERPYKDVIADIEAFIPGISLPNNEYSVKIGGEKEEMERSFNSLLLALLISVALVYMILAAQFESLKQPLIIMFTVPLALVGVVFTLFLTDHSFNVMSAIGIIILVGIVVNDAIIKLDFINQSRRKGKAVRNAIVEAGRKRLRPILMTTVTTVIGLSPMAIGFGSGTEMQAPLAISVIGGLTSATLLTLIVIPVIYSYFEKM